MKSRTFILLCLVTIASSRSLSIASQFVPLGFLDANAPSSTATAVDATGRTVVGFSDLNGQQTAFIWRQSTGMQPIETSHGSVAANAITPDGTTIVGWTRTNQGGNSFITSSSQGFTSIGSLAPYSVFSVALAVSPDGQVVAGYSPTDSMASEAYRWTRQGGIEPLGTLPDGSRYSDASGISADGSVIVGSSDSAEGYQAYRWTKNIGMVGLGDLPGGDFSSGANAVSADGKIIVGSSNSANGVEAFRWDQSSGMVGLGFLPGASSLSEALAVTPDGSAIVGASGDAIPSAFVWDAAHGMRSLVELLNADPHLVGDLTGWQLYWAAAISANGQAIVGRGINPQGQVEGYLVLLDAPLGVPEPSAPLLCISFSATCLCVARHRYQ